MFDKQPNDRTDLEQLVSGTSRGLDMNRERQHQRRRFGGGDGDCRGCAGFAAAAAAAARPRHGATAPAEVERSDERVEVERGGSIHAEVVVCETD